MDITVIIPAFNRAWSLPRAIESCRDTTGLRIQIIVADDGSSDGTAAVLKTIPGIEVYHQENWGKPWAVNMAYQHAKGKYIKFLDSDDWILPGALRRQFDIAEQKKADIVVAGYDLYEDDEFIRTQPWVICEDFIAQNLGECDSSHYSAFLFRKEFIDDIPHRTSFAAAGFASRDDRCFMLEAALKDPFVAICPAPALAHSQHRKGRLQFQTGIASACTNYQHLLIYKNILNRLSAAGQLTMRRIKAAENVLWPLCHWIAKDDIAVAAGLLDWIRELDPEFEIPAAGFIGFLYRNIGFKRTEKLLNIRRVLLQ